MKSTKAQKAEAMARKMIHSLSTESLLNQWEATTTNNDENIPTVRGWLMDELESRFPKAFDKWLDEDGEDDTLRHYIYKAA